MKYDVFISYSRKDYVDEHMNVIPGNVVSKVKDALTGAGITYWFDDEGMYSGDNFTEKIVSNIEISQIFVFLSTENSNKSRWTCKEIASADEFGKYIIPVRIDRTPYNKKVMFRIADLSYIDYYQNPEKGINDLIASIKAYLAQIQEEANRKKAEEEKKREAERRKAEEEKRKREEEEKLRQKQQQELIESIKLSNATINNEESKLQLDRENLLLKVEKVTDNVKRDALKQAINTGGAIHLKYQKEQTDLKKKIQEYEQLVEKLQRQVDEINADSEGKDLHTKQIQTELEEAQIKIKKLQDLIEGKNDASQSQEEEHKRVVDSLSKKIEELQKELKEKQESTNNGKYTLNQVLKDYWIWLLLLVLSLVGPLFYFIYKSNEMESSYEYARYFERHYRDILDKISNNAPVPLVITDIEIKNSGDNWGDIILSSETTYLVPRIEYIGLTEGQFMLYAKYFDNEGNKYTAKDGHFPSNNINIEYSQLYERSRKELTGWGNDNLGHWSAGTYRIEIWYEEQKLAEKTFLVN
ncbi:MAG: TIR domain-containing protein [Bacteroidales bacterium]|nr:TIR domain-containing protein [Bacteroidales bacterium]